MQGTSLFPASDRPESLVRSSSLVKRCAILLREWRPASLLSLPPPLSRNCAVTDLPGSKSRCIAEEETGYPSRVADPRTAGNVGGLVCGPGQYAAPVTAFTILNCSPASSKAEGSPNRRIKALSLLLLEILTASVNVPCIRSMETTSAFNPPASSTVFSPAAAATSKRNDERNLVGIFQGLYRLRSPSATDSANDAIYGLLTGSAECMEPLPSPQPSPRIRTEQVPAVFF